MVLTACGGRDGHTKTPESTAALILAGVALVALFFLLRYLLGKPAISEMEETESQFDQRQY